MAFETYTLPNGIRVVHGQNKSPVAYCGVVVNAGTRDEQEEEHGMAHFIEHVLFKGTQRRKAYHITSRLDDVGGELNAYTTKEETVVHATVLKEDFHRAIELLFDVVFKATFPEKEIEKEKVVVLDEINSYKDSPSELIFDDFEEILYPNHPFGRNILGSKKRIKGFTREGILKFVDRNYNTDQIVVCSIGNIPFKRVVALAQRYFGTIAENPRQEERTPISQYVPQRREIKKNTYQRHCMIGSQSYGLTHPKRVGMLLLANILGGPGQNSRLNLALRERNGLGYNVEAIFTPYSDTGVFSVYFGVDRGNYDKALNLVFTEMKRLREAPLGIRQLATAKKQLIGQLAIAAEHNEALMLGVARSVMYYNSIDSVDVMNQKIESLTAEEIQEIANEALHIENLSTLIYM